MTRHSGLAVMSMLTAVALIYASVVIPYSSHVTNVSWTEAQLESALAVPPVDNSPTVGELTTTTVSVVQTMPSHEHNDQTNTSGTESAANGEIRTNDLVIDSNVTSQIDMTNSTNDTNNTTPEPTEETKTTLPLNETFSACMLVMDENFRLREWLAYHYHVLPLRHIVVAVDPESKTSPVPILDMFRRELGLEYTVWNDTNFSYTINMEEHVDKDDPRMKREVYLKRQRRFLEECMEHLHKRGHKWTALLDADEFVTIEPSTPHRPNFTELTGQPDFAQPGSALRYIEQRRGSLLSSASSMAEADRSCFVIMRVLFSAKESPEMLAEFQSSMDPDLQETIDPYRLDTVRWRFHANVTDRLSGLGKPFIDVSQLGPHLPLQVRNPHRVVMQVCPSPFPVDTYEATPLRINHYLGSWEQYSHRDDARKGIERSKEAWQYRARHSYGPDTLTNRWLRGFVQSVGTKKAILLLRDTGLPRGYTKPTNGGGENITDTEADTDKGWKLQKDVFNRRHDNFHDEFLNWVEKNENQKQRRDRKDKKGMNRNAKQQDKRQNRAPKQTKASK